jgi:lactoylglutathione lyase
MKTFASSLVDWTDIDIAAAALARSLGLLPSDRIYDAKWVFWSRNPLGDELFLLLDRLTALGLLEKRDEPDFQYRVRPEFRNGLGVEEIWQRARPTPALELIVLRCAELELSKRFYEALGLTFTAEQHGSGPRHYSSRLGSTVLELYPATAPVTPIRLGLGVPDVDAAADAVGALGDFVLRHPTNEEPYSVLVRDPDMNKIELTLLRP